MSSRGGSSRRDESRSGSRSASGSGGYYSGGSRSGSRSSRSGSKSSRSGSRSFESYESNSDLGIPAYHDSDVGESGDSMSGGDEVSVQLKCLYVNERYQIKCNGKTTVSELRRKLSKEADHPASKLRLYHHGYALEDDNQTLKAAKFGKGEPRAYYIYLRDDDLDTPFDKDGNPDLAKMKRQFDTAGQLKKSHAIEILKKAEQIMKEEPNVVEVDDPVSVIGDIHGQWFDMAGIMGAAGKFGQRNHVFMGDYVDRGYFSSEVLLYLCAAKIVYPDKVFLLRGNHESEKISKSYGSAAEFERKYGRRCLKAAQKLFQSLPICGLISSVGKRIICMHGGLSPDVKTIDQINDLDRFCEPSKGNPVKDFVWADPSKDYRTKRNTNAYDLANLKEHSYNKGDFKDGFGENEGRGGSSLYEYKGALAFCDKNDLIGIFRGHEQPESGLGLDQFQYGPKYEFPVVSTVFSAPNYTDTSHNKGTVANITEGKLRFRQYTWALHPEYYGFDKKVDHRQWFTRNMDSEDLIQFLNYENHDTLRGVPFQMLKGEYIALFQKVQGHTEEAKSIEKAIEKGGSFKNVNAMPRNRLTKDQLEQLRKEQKKITKKYKDRNLFSEAVEKEKVYEQDPDGSTWNDAIGQIKARNDMVGTIARNLNAAGAKTAYKKLHRSARALCT